MPQGYFEHVNITVSDPDRSCALLTALCGWHERWRGPAGEHGWSIHVGTSEAYVVLNANGQPPARRVKGVPLNHIGLVVDDLAAAEAVVIAAGLEPFGHADYDPGRRFYFFDWDGIEFEVVSYG